MRHVLIIGFPFVFYSIQFCFRNVDRLKWLRTTSACFQFHRSAKLPRTSSFSFKLIACLHKSFKLYLIENKHFLHRTEKPKKKKNGKLVRTWNAMEEWKIWKFDMGAIHHNYFNYCFHATNHVIFVVIFLQFTQIPCASKIIDSICLGQETSNGYFLVKENIDTGTHEDSLPTR